MAYLSLIHIHIFVLFISFLPLFHFGFVGFPFDTVKTKMQTTKTNMSMLSAIRVIQIEDGILGFYRGVAAPLFALTILNTMNFSVYAMLKTKLKVEKDITYFEPKIFLAGSAVGPVASLISTPFELVKLQMQVYKQYSSSINAAVSILHRQGILALYKGHQVNTFREMLFLGTYFTVYEHSKNIFVSSLPSVLAIPLAGGFSGSIGWFVSFPLDSIKANIQGAVITEKAKSVREIAKIILKTRGLLGLYSGILPSISRAFLVSASRFSVYECIISALKS